MPLHLCLSLEMSNSVGDASKLKQAAETVGTLEDESIWMIGLDWIGFELMRHWTRLDFSVHDNDLD